MLYESRQTIIKLFSDYSSIVSEVKHKEKYGEGLNILRPKQMLQRLPIILAQVKAVSTSENLLNELRQILYFFVSKKYSKSVQQCYELFLNSENSKTSEPHGLLLNLSDKVNLKRSDKYVPL